MHGTMFLGDFCNVIVKPRENCKRKMQFLYNSLKAEATCPRENKTSLCECSKSLYQKGSELQKNLTKYVSFVDEEVHRKGAKNKCFVLFSTH